MLRQTEREVRRQIRKEGTPFIKRALGEVVVFSSRQLRKRFGEIEIPALSSKESMIEEAPSEDRGLEISKRLVDFFIANPEGFPRVKDKKGRRDFFLNFNTHVGADLMDDDLMINLSFPDENYFLTRDQEEYADKLREISPNTKSAWHHLINPLIRLDSDYAKGRSTTIGFIRNKKTSGDIRLLSDETEMGIKIALSPRQR